MKKTVTTLQLKSFKTYLKPRPRSANKGLFGHVVVVGGDYGYSGAPQMAAMAALRVGAGLVSIATRKEHALVLNVAHPEIMCHGVQTAKELMALLKKATVVIVGPGLGQSSWSSVLLSVVLKQSVPLIVDADALNLIAKKPQKHSQWILTPHPGEAARLLKLTTADIQKNRVSAVQQLQKKYGGIAVLKGEGSLITGPSHTVAQCLAGNPGMASAGMGDILSGVIGGLAAQHIPLEKAAELGVLVHAKAGDLAAKDGERGMIATDLYPFIRRLVNP